MVKVKIICPNVEELNFHIINKTFKDNMEEINTIFPNIKYLNVFIYRNFDLINLFNQLKNSKIEKLGIFIFKFYKNNIRKDKKEEIKEIIMNNVTNLRIDIDKNCDFMNDSLMNEIFKELFVYIQFPNLKNYKLYLNMNKLKNMNINRISNKYKTDYNYINCFIFDILINKKQFEIKSFFEIPNKLIDINKVHINLENLLFVYKIEEDFEKHSFKLNICNEKEFKEYYLNYDFSIDNKEIYLYKKLDIKGIKQDKIIVEKIIENNEINLCDINLDFNLKQYEINSFKNIRSIYCQNEIQNNTLQNLMNVNEFNNLKYINITIGYIKESYKDKNLLDNHIYKYLSQLIQKSKNLKSLILRFHPNNNFNENVNFIISLIKDLKKLRILNISSNSELEFPLKNLFEIYPWLKQKKYLFEEFIINKSGFIIIKNDKRKKNIDKSIQCIYNIQNNEKEVQIINCNDENKKIISNYCVLYLNDEKINFCEKYKFLKKGKNEIKMRFIKYFSNTGGMFYGCSSLISLNLSNFNTNNVNNMSYMFSGLNKSCKIETKAQKILDENK